MRHILDPGRNCSDIGEVTRTGLLIDACDYYRAFYRTAETAERYILLSGWQFDSDLRLLRGREAEEAGEDRLLMFLNRLCERTKGLQIYILAWNFSMIYSLDREWFQKWYFNWTTHRGLKFCFDHCHALGASHHQKFVVVDNRVAFVGGLDLCSGRWDERDHRSDNVHRVNSDGSAYTPFHDIQSYHVGPVAERLAELFKARWRIVCGEDLDLRPPAQRRTQIRFKPTIPLEAEHVAISRTEAASPYGNAESVREIRQLFVDAIHSAERLIYFENQYFSSEALYRALVERMTERRSPLEIVLVLTKQADALVEQISIGIAQVKILRDLQRLARENGHSVGIYYAASTGPDGREMPTYIHSKFLLVDDRFLTVGSANMNNRSMGLDTELNVSWEALLDDRALGQSIRDVRIDLLAEHTGLTAAAMRGELGRTKGLVDYLDRLAAGKASRLRHHPIETVEYPLLTSFLPEGLPFDPEGPIFDETHYEGISDKKDGFFSRGVTSLRTWLQNITQPTGDDPAQPVSKNAPSSEPVENVNE
jgi:phosphatidylserine/phosphatidylglycerophosphate/cardiolipin synthase-like enzyme